jgi:hypothetical protein
MLLLITFLTTEWRNPPSFSGHEFAQVITSKERKQLERHRGVKAFYSAEEVIIAYNENKIDLHANIKSKSKLS